MIDKSVPSEFDWVTARAERSLYRAFKELLKGVEQDVDKHNTHRQQGDPSKWTMAGVSSNGFSVIREEASFHPSGASIDFMLSEKGITVSDEKGAKFTAVLSLNNEGRCIFKVDKAEMEQSQVRRLALESLFFAPI